MEETAVTKETDLAARLQSPVLRDIFAYWRRLCGTRRMPSRADIEPMAIARLLPHVYLLDVVPAPRDYRFRLMGTAISGRYGDDHTGKRIAEVLGDRGPMLALALRIFDTVVDERRPLRAGGPVAWRNDEHATFECICLPLSDADDAVNMIFGGMVFALRSVRGRSPTDITFD